MARTRSSFCSTVLWHLDSAGHEVCGLATTAQLDPFGPPTPEGVTHWRLFHHGICNVCTSSLFCLEGYSTTNHECHCRIWSIINQVELLLASSPHDAVINAGMSHRYGSHSIHGRANGPSSLAGPHCSIKQRTVDSSNQIRRLSEHGRSFTLLCNIRRKRQRITVRVVRNSFSLYEGAALCIGNAFGSPSAASWRVPRRFIVLSQTIFSSTCYAIRVIKADFWSESIRQCVRMYEQRPNPGRKTCFHSLRTAAVCQICRFTNIPYNATRVPPCTWACSRIPGGFMHGC